MEKWKVLKTEIDGARKQTQKEMEQNEILEHIKQRISNESNKLSRQREFKITFSGDNQTKFSNLFLFYVFSVYSNTGKCGIT